MVGLMNVNTNYKPEALGFGKEKSSCYPVTVSASDYLLRKMSRYCKLELEDVVWKLDVVSRINT